MTLEAGKVPGPLEIRAMPHVVVEARIRDSQGRPAIGENFQLFGQVDAGGEDAGSNWSCRARMISGMA